jgi:hypothetical protein
MPTTPIPGDTVEQVRRLWEANRLRCGWFLKEGFIPQTRDEALRCLTLLLKHGDRATYVLARKLLQCL